MAGQQPVAKFQAGCVTCALWENEATVNGRQITIMKATLERRFMDSRGEWRTAGSFARNEIPLAIFCLGKAFEAIIARDCERRSSAVTQEEVVE